MSDTEVASDGMTAADTKFLIACLRNSIGGSVQVRRDILFDICKWACLPRIDKVYYYYTASLELYSYRSYSSAASLKEHLASKLTQFRSTTRLSPSPRASPTSSRECSHTYYSAVSNTFRVANKIAVLRKKYNLPLGGKVVNSDGGGAPTTPSKAKPAKVIKKTPKAAAKPRKTPIKKSVKKEEESTEEADEEMEETDDAEVETLKVKADDDEDVA